MMHPEDIKAALRKMRVSQHKIAKALNVAPSSVYNVIHGGCKSERIAKYISDLVGVDRSELWPGRYDPPAVRRENAA
jgi:lambda repressor-like predicted transcriptional regulator